MRNRSKAVLLFVAFNTALFAQQPEANEPALQLPDMVIKDLSMVVGAQFNPFVNSLTKKLKYVNISRVKEGSIAARAGLKNGDRVVEINGLRLPEYRLADVPAIHVPAVNRQAKLEFVVRRKDVSEPLAITLVLETSGSINWDLSTSVLQKKNVKTDEWHVDKASNQPPATARSKPASP